jgi:sucrose-6-phosphate hydrolase SacC (GH32 family)
MRLLLMRCHFMVSFYLICSVVRGQSLVEKNLNINANISDFGNNTLFLRWRPTFHFLAPAGHMNDPCGPM